MRAVLTSLVILTSAGAAMAQPAGGSTGPAAQDDLEKAADAAAEAASVSPSTDDLAKAADAAADVATVPAAASPPGAARPSSDDIDLAALGLDPAGQASSDDQLSVYGFADFMYSQSHYSKSILGTTRDRRTFAVGNLDLYLAKSLMPRARALAEVRFTFLPNGSFDAHYNVFDSTATDLTNYSRPVQWGAIVIERAYVEYDLTDYLTVRAGHWLTPYGIWNIDHGSPVIIPIGKPYIIGEQFFPDHQTGLDLFGSRALGGYKLGYHLTASNGRGGAEAQQDQDDKFAFGGRLEIETPWGLRLGGSYYRGRYTGLPAAIGAQGSTYLEAGYAGDAQLDLGGLHVQGELIVRERHYPDSQRTATAAGFDPDGRFFGWYALAGYRFHHLWNVMPFGYVQYYRPADPVLFKYVALGTGGFNFRPTPSLVFKASLGYSHIPEGPGNAAGLKAIDLLAQACWVF